MNIVNLNELSGIAKGKMVEARKIPSNFSAQAVNVVLQAGGVLPTHTTPVDVIFYVIKGTGIVEVGDEKKEVSQGMFIDSPANIPHGWYNESEEELSVLVVKLFK
jgi:quercetin dioxygenase-like cupin family protein